METSTRETIYDPQLDKFYTREEFVETSRAEPARNIVIIMKWREPWLPLWLSVPHMTVASDSISGHRADGSLLPWGADYSEYAGHPRAAGNHARTLRLARENNVPLMFSISQLSYWAAQHLGDTGLQAMKDRGTAAGWQGRRHNDLRSGDRYRQRHLQGWGARSSVNWNSLCYRQWNGCRSRL